MNPAAQSLDPKLKEVYDRVMGTPTSAPSSKPPPPPNPTAQPAHVPVEQVVVPQQPPAQTSQDSSPAEPEMVSINTTAPEKQVNKSNRKISPIIFVAVGVGFFLLYTVIWLKVFKIF